MNLDHFRTFLWLNWRLRLNRARRAGLASQVLMGLVAALLIVVDVGSFVGAFCAGWLLPHDVSPSVVMYIWDGLLLAFLTFWTTGLLADLQRGDALSLDKFLHLPVSLSGAFVINYVSSLFSLTLVLLLPAMLGLSAGLVVWRGAVMLVLFPLLAAVLLMVTALTYQFQGWLATLMTNQRRRRTIVVMLTMLFVGLAQVPNLVNLFGMPGFSQQSFDELQKQRNAITHDFAAGKITQQQMNERLTEAQAAHIKRTDQAYHDTWRKAEQIAWVANLAIPPGWMALAAREAAEGVVWPSVLATLGLSTIGVGSLWRSYRTTLRLYTGAYTSGAAKREPERVEPAKPGAATAARRPTMLEWRLPWVSDGTAAVALGCFRSLVRAPEAKMMLMSSVILFVILGAVLGRGVSQWPEGLRPMLPFSMLAFLLFGTVQMAGNQFGFDRDGFQVYVLSGVPRREVLLGKNLALAPLLLGLGGLAIAAVQCFRPLRIDLFLATAPQFLAMYLVFCLVTNAMSILAPVQIPAGALRATNPGMAAVVLQLVCFLFVFPVSMSPMLLPTGVQWWCESRGWLSRMPVGLLLMVLECAMVVALYWFALGWQGRWLQAREQRILDVVKTKAE